MGGLQHSNKQAAGGRACALHSRPSPPHRPTPQTPNPNSRGRLLGAGVDFGPQTDWGRWSAELAMDPAAPRPWLFVAQQKRLSNREMGVYEDHVSAAEQVDEDFFGNFS